MSMHNPRKILFRSIGLVFFILILVFMYTRFQAYLKGPRMIQSSFDSYTSISRPSAIFFGTTKHTEGMNIDGRTITLDENGGFKEVMVFSPGHTIIEVQLTDTFGRERYYTYNVFAQYEMAPERDEEEVLEEQEEVTDIL